MRNDLKREADLPLRQSHSNSHQMFYLFSSPFLLKLTIIVQYWYKVKSDVYSTSLLVAL